MYLKDSEFHFEHNKSISFAYFVEPEIYHVLLPRFSANAPHQELTFVKHEKIVNEMEEFGIDQHAENDRFLSNC